MIEKWPDARVPYVLDSRLNEMERAAVARAVKALESRTCLRFESKEDEDRDYVHIGRGDGCAAHVSHHKCHYNWI